MPHSDDMIEKSETQVKNVTHLLSACREGKALGQELIKRFLYYVWILPASESHHHSEEGGLFKHSLEVALKALGKFEMGFVQERESDGTLDVFSSNMNRPRWRYATFVAGLFHDLGKAFDVIVTSSIGGQVWDPLSEPLHDFCGRHATYKIDWRPDRKPGKHAWISTGLATKLLARADIEYMGIDRWVQALEAIAHDQHLEGNQILRYVRESDHESTRDGLVTIKRMVDDKVSQFLRAVRTLIKSGDLKINCRGAEVYVSEGRAAMIVPRVIVQARTFLSGERIPLPDNIVLYNLLRDRGVVVANEDGKVVKKIKVHVGSWRNDSELAAIVLQAESILQPSELPVLREDVGWEVISEGDELKNKDKNVPGYIRYIERPGVERCAIG